MKKVSLLSVMALVALSSFVFATVMPATTNSSSKPMTKKMMKVKVKHHKGSMVGTMESTGVKK